MPDTGEPLQDLIAALQTANERIEAAVADDDARDGMGTTVTALLLSGDRLAALNVGDSRCYLLRDGELTQLTRDDTYVQALVDQGVLTPDDARRHPQRALVTQAVQGGPFRPAGRMIPARVGDRLPAVQRRPLRLRRGRGDRPDPARRTRPQDCAAELVHRTLENGAPDNVTVIVADVVEILTRRLAFLAHAEPADQYRFVAEAGRGHTVGWVDVADGARMLESGAELGRCVRTVAGASRGCGGVPDSWTGVLLGTTAERHVGGRRASVHHAMKPDREAPGASRHLPAAQGHGEVGPACLGDSRTTDSVPGSQFLRRRCTRRRRRSAPGVGAALRSRVARSGARFTTRCHATAIVVSLLVDEERRSASTCSAGGCAEPSRIRCATSTLAGAPGFGQSTAADGVGHRC